jgi:hypothetical protein
MPRPYPIPTVQPFTVGEAEKREIARVLKLERLPPEIDGAIAAAIAVYKATGNRLKRYDRREYTYGAARA